MHVVTLGAAPMAETIPSKLSGDDAVRSRCWRLGPAGWIGRGAVAALLVVVGMFVLTAGAAPTAIPPVTTLFPGRCSCPPRGWRSRRRSAI
jgi:hypothetical protein